MKIALICTEKLPVPPVSGGAIQIYIDAILPVLATKHEITVFCVQNIQLPLHETNGNVRYIRVKGKTADEYLHNVKKALTNEYDLVHVFNRPLWVPILSEIASESAFSLSLHNEMFTRKKIDSDRAAKCIERVSFITTVSQFIANGVKALYPEAEPKLNVVYSAADLNQFTPIWSEEAQEERTALRTQYGLDDHKVILYVGRLCAKKGAHIVMQAMKNIFAANPKTALLLVGSKWYGQNATDEFIERLQAASQELSGPVIFTGFLTPAEIPRYFHVGDIFVCASQWREPLARVHYEAMAAGLPIITTNRGGNAEVLEPGVNGLVIQEYNNPLSMEENIQYLLDHPEIALNMGKMGRQLVEEKYNWDRVANQLLRLFEGV